MKRRQLRIPLSNPRPAVLARGCLPGQNSLNATLRHCKGTKPSTGSTTSIRSTSQRSLGPVPALLRRFKIPIAATGARLRGLVQHVLSPVAPSAISPRLDCFQALGIKRYTLVRQAKLGASCGVKVPTGQGLTSHPYRVLQRCRRLGTRRGERGGPNEAVEAYTGNHVDRREGRTSQSLIQPREKRLMQTAMVLTCHEAG